MRAINVGLRFLLELAGVAAVAYWGSQAGDGAGRWILAIGAALVLIVVWGVVIAPRARNPIPQHVRIVLGSGLLLLAAALLAVAGQPTAGVALAVLVVVNTVLLFLLRD